MFICAKPLKWRVPGLDEKRKKLKIAVKTLFI